LFHWLLNLIEKVKTGLADYLKSQQKTEFSDTKKLRFQFL